MRLWTALVLMVAFVTDAPAQGLSNAEAFWAVCSSALLPEEKMTFKLACATYLAGAFDLQRAYDTMQPANAPWCSPEYVSPQTLLDVTIKYMNDHPEKRVGMTVGVF